MIVVTNNMGTIMGLRQPTELRLHRRRRLVGFMPGRLFIAETGEEIVCRPLDVSAYGLGMFTEDEIDEFVHDFVLVVAERTIRLERVYSQESPGLKVGYRHGFRVKDRDVDLEKLCIELGYI
jgi:hypothetical protein